MYIAKWFINASISFNAANSTYFQPMIDALYSMSSGCKAPSMHCLCDDLLNSWVDDVHKLVVSLYLKKKTGCTLMADGWIDRKRRTLTNFLVYCPKGTIFLKKFVDVSHASKSADLLF